MTLFDFIKQRNVVQCLVNAALRGAFAGMPLASLGGISKHFRRTKTASKKASRGLLFFCFWARKTMVSTLLGALFSAGYSLKLLYDRNRCQSSVLRLLDNALDSISKFDSTSSRLLKRLTVLELLHSKFTMPYPPSTVSIADKSMKGVAFWQLFNVINKAIGSQQRIFDLASAALFNCKDLYFHATETLNYQAHATSTLNSLGSIETTDNLLQMISAGNIDGSPLNHLKKSVALLKEKRLRLLGALLFSDILSGPQQPVLVNSLATSVTPTLLHPATLRLIRDTLAKVVENINVSLQFFKTEYDPIKEASHNDSVEGSGSDMYERSSLDDLKNDYTLLNTISNDFKIVDYEIVALRFKLEALLGECRANSIDEKTLGMFIDEFRTIFFFSGLLF
ncbi:hypothetical protein BC829DRAFT_302961 [Chytridium lagenaria]|nr:hypothetical protein BC829DRAFT_302961 [Chytridium lagenaria]